jgi:hypothetical protein
MPETAKGAIEQNADSLVEHFQVADQIVVESSTLLQEFAISVDNPAFGPLTRLDHPIVSMLACAAAQSTEKPIVVSSTEETAVTLKIVSDTDD